jgi:hypothetical protein
VSKDAQVDSVAEGFAWIDLAADQALSKFHAVLVKSAVTGVVHPHARETSHAATASAKTVVAIRVKSAVPAKTALTEIV